MVEGEQTMCVVYVNQKSLATMNWRGFQMIPREKKENESNEHYNDYLVWWWGGQMSKPRLTKKITRTPNYQRAKHDLMDAFVLRKPLRQIAKELGISVPTACKWQEWLILDNGNLDDAKMYKKKIEFITKNLGEIEFTKERLMRCIKKNEEDPKAMTGLTNALSAMHKSETDILSRFNIIQPEQIEVKHFAGEGIEIVFLDENKRKMIDVVPAEVVEE